MSPCCSPTSPPPPRPSSGTTRRTEKVAAVAAALRSADPDEVPVVVAYLSGELRQRRTGVGWASLRDLPPPGRTPTLGVSEVDATLADVAALAGAGSQARAGTPGGRPVRPGDRARAAAAARPAHRRAAPGRARGRDARRRSRRRPAVPLADVRRAAMLRGAVGPVAEAALTGGDGGARGVPAAGRPPGAADAGVDRHRRRRRAEPAAARPRSSGSSTASGCRCTGPAATCRVFTRSLDDITDRVPEVVEAALALPVRDVVLDGEAIALRPDGRPRPFQQTGSRVVLPGRRRGGRGRRRPLSTYVFDVLHVDGEDVLDRPGGTGPRCSRPRSPSRCGCRGW